MKLERAAGPRASHRRSSGCHLTSLSASAVRSALNFHRALAASPSPSRLTAPRGIAIFDNLKRESAGCRKGYPGTQFSHHADADCNRRRLRRRSGPSASQRDEWDESHGPKNSSPKLGEGSAPRMFGRVGRNDGDDAFRPRRMRTEVVLDCSDRSALREWGAEREASAFSS